MLVVLLSTATSLGVVTHAGYDGAPDPRKSRAGALSVRVGRTQKSIAKEVFVLWFV